MLLERKMFEHSAIPARITQIIKQLRPFFGTKIDGLMNAYLAEDKEGREQIENYLELLSGKYLTIDFNSNAQLIPPATGEADGSYKLGKVVYGSKQMGDFGLREDEWIAHSCVFGRTGAGKTNLGFQMVKQIRQQNKPILIFDWKRNYRDLLALPEFQDIEVYTVGRNVSPFAFNPLIPPPGTSPKTYLKKLSEVLAHAYCLGNGVLYLLQQSLDAVYEEAGVYDETVQRWPTFQDVLTKAQKINARGRESGWLASTLRALATICFGDMGDLVNSESARSPADLLQKTVILELDALAQQDKVMLIESMLLWIHHWRMAQKDREEFKHVIMIEEAHHVLSNERRSLIGGQSVMEITFREIREFGEALILLDQHPSQISLPALGNTYTTICLNLKHSKDVSAMAQCMLLDGDEKDILGQLGVGQAVVKLQGRVQKPFMIEIPKFQIEKGKITDEIVREKMATINPNRTKKTPVETMEDDTPQKEDSNETKFLKDVKDNPDSGIAARYKRLSISVRQGQKLKAYLCAEGLIDEKEARTSTGKTIQLNLTEEGESFLATA